MLVDPGIPNAVGGAPMSGRAHYFQNSRTNKYYLCGLKAFIVAVSIKINVEKNEKV